MTCTTDTTSKRPLSAKLMGGVAVAALLALGAFATPASADWHGDRRGYYGGYYQAPPVVYGGGYYNSPYYAPPVIYGPGIGINLPGVSIGIQ
jgi:hypothetical protein